MRDIILSFPTQFQKGISAAASVSLNKKYVRIITCGMGGSAIAGEMLSLIDPRTVVHWDYDLPTNTSQEDLVICTSWSGGTEETISAYEKARQLGVDVICITMGGQLAEKAKVNNTPLVVLPAESIPPRTAVGIMTAALLKVVGQEKELPINIDAGLFEVRGKEIAQAIGAKTPLIYTTFPWRKLAGQWKVLFNENAKVHAFANWLPSAAHNEIAGFSSNTRNQFATIVMQDLQDNPRHKKSLAALLAIFDKMEYNYSIVELSPGGTRPLEKAFFAYILGLWTSYYLAENLGVDPSVIELVEQFKQLKK